VDGRRLFAGLALVALTGAACGGGESDGQTSGGGDGGGDGGADVTLTAKNISYDPESLTVASGGSIRYSNKDGTEHNFTAEKAGVDEDVEPGSSVTIDLGDVEPGTYDFHCEYHPDSMQGTLEVTG
jgi:plastocyanin